MLPKEKEANNRLEQEKAKDKELYIEIETLIRKTQESIPLRNYGNEELSTIAKIILRLRKQQEQLVYKHDFFKFVEDNFQGLQEKLKTPQFHIDIYNAYQTYDRVCVVCPRGHAKAQSLDSKILTPSGWVLLKDINIGDMVIGYNGKPTIVTELHPISKMKLYRVTTRDGRSTLCNEEHVWSVLIPQNTKNNKLVNRTLKQLIPIYKKQRIDKRSLIEFIENKVHIPTVLPIQFEEKYLPIDPYVLGAWLGDGTSCNANITSADPEMFTYFPYNVKKKKQKYLYLVDGLHKLLRENNLLKNKHIPEEYFTSSVNQRTALLQGLIDTDGSISSDGMQISFCNKNEKIIDGIIDIIRSLGGTASKGEQLTRFDKLSEYKHSFKVTGRLPKEIIPVKLSRKLNKWIGSIKTFSSIVDISYEKTSLGRCITVGNKDGMYITDDYLVTHNSSTARIFALHQILNRKVRFVVLIGSSQEVAAQNARWIREQIESNPNIIKIYGNLKNPAKWSDSEFMTIDNIRVVAKGAGQKLRGMNEQGRPDLIILDDLEDDEAVENKENRSKFSNWFRKAVLPSKSKSGKIFIVGTILDEDSLLKNIAKNKIKDHIDWKILFYKAINRDTNGKEYALWEEMKPLHELKVLERDDPEAFAQEFQNDPLSNDRALFKKEWFRYYTASKIEVKQEYRKVFFDKEELNVIITTDFAISERSGSDYTVVMATGMDSKGNLYLLEMDRFRTSDPDEAIERTLDMAVRWYASVIFGEDVVFSVVFLKMLQSLMDRKGLSIPVEGLKRDKSVKNGKLIRIKALVSPIKRGNILWDEEILDLEEEILQVSVTKTGRHDDMVECLADSYLCQQQFLVSESEDTATINTVAWVIETGRFPTVEEEDYDLELDY